MSNTPYVRAVMAQATLELVPPLIRETLLEKREFREEYGFKADAVLSFGNTGLSIQRSALFEAIREILSGTSELDVTDTKDRQWKLKNEAGRGDLPILVISEGQRRLILPDFSGFSLDSTIRLRSLDKTASDVNLPTSAKNTWRDILSERPFDDDEIDLFHSDIRDNPVYVARFILSEMGEGKSSISSIVPASRRYFERLVGSYDGSLTIRDYAAGAGRKLFEQLSAWRPYDGFLFSLLLSSHSALTAEISVEHIENEDLVRAFVFLEKQGDRISQLGAIEVGLRILHERPDIEPHIIRLVEKIQDDEVEESTRGLKLLSALFILVDGELSRTRLMSAEPPFYRRLASLSQAALIHRQLVNSRADDSFCEWAYRNRGEQYYMQSLADMRLEPRWNPDLAAASQMKSDFLGRIMIEGKNYEENIKNSVLHGLILGAEPGSLQLLCKFPYQYYPGPLEGAEDCPNTLPIDLSEMIEVQLTKEEVGPSSFIAIVNSAMIFRIDSNQVELAAKALKLANYRLANLENKSQLLGILNGLATVAAVTRSPMLADELRIIVRGYRRDDHNGLSIDEAMSICLVASASRKELMDWREFAGAWLTELAFGEFEGDEGRVLHSHIRCLCHAVPELWVSCARADAALMAYNDR